ncbi:unnamed protein product, partial [marine sediment metagenome]
GLNSPFVLLTNHHENYDLWDSTHEWNSVRVGPHKDIARMFKESAREAGLRFGASMHPSHTTWFSPARLMSDSSGPYKGKPYDGTLTKADGKGTWWEGLDPQKLYGKPDSHLRKWNAEERLNYFVRIADFIDNYQPELLYFDHGDLPKAEAGINIAAHLYNSSTKQHGTNQAVLTIKSTRPYAIKDVERGVTDRKEEQPWQTDMCIGDWYYSENVKYKSPTSMIQMLVDIVSKNGNLLLNIPLKASGDIDQGGIDTLQEFGEWLNTNGEGIYGTRPWAALGEGNPATKGSAHHNWKNVKFTSQDIRYTCNGDTIYAFVMDWPTDGVRAKALGKNSPFISGTITKFELLGHGELPFEQKQDHLFIDTPKDP